MSQKKAIVLSSGGVDSTTCLAVAIDRFGKDNVASVSIFYGQKHRKELVCAKKIADYYGVKHYEFDVSGILAYSNCSLLENSSEQIAHGSYDQQVKLNENGKVSTYVPFRNGLMLSVCASFAQSIFEKDDVALYLGAHGDDAAGNAYADCSEEFVSSMGKAISIGTYDQVHIESPFVKTNKAGVVRTGLSLKVPYELTWSCYEGNDKPCGKCGTCIDRAKAFAENGAADPAL